MGAPERAFGGPLRHRQLRLEDQGAAERLGGRHGDVQAGGQLLYRLFQVVSHHPLRGGKFAVQMGHTP